MNEPKVFFDGEYLTLDQVENTLKRKWEQHDMIVKEIGDFIVDIVSDIKDAQLLNEDIDRLSDYRHALRNEKERQNDQ